MKSSVERTGLTDLMRAAVDEDPTVLLKLLLTGNYEANLFMRDKKGRTALDWARMCRNYHAVSILLQAMSSGISNARLDAMHSPLELEVYIKETNAYQAAELLKALKNRDVPYTMRILSENKLYREEVEGLGEVFFVDAVAHSGYTPLIIAAGFGMVEVIDSLLEYKTPIDHTNKFGHTAFTYACAAGNSDIARMLLFFGADVHHTTAEGRTGLHYCCMYAKARTVKVILSFLLERFATFRIEGHSMIDFDSTRWTKYAEILEGLINVRDKNGKLATDLIPDQLRTGYSIEARLRITGVAELLRLGQAPRDERSMQTDYGYAYNESDDISAVSELNDDFSYAADPADVGDGLNFGLNTAREPLEESFAQQESSFLDDGIALGTISAAPLVGNGAETENEIVHYNAQDTARDEEQSQISEVSANTFQSAAQFTHDTDNMHAADIHNITDAHSVRTALPLDQEVDTIKALFKRTRERISDWLASAEKEKELARLLPCVLNCGMMCKVENLTFHVRDDCPLRSIQCQLCSKPVRFVDMKKHKAKLCPKRVVACPNAYHGCCEQVTVETTESHVMLKCKVRKMVCRQFCGASVPYNKRENHELLHCKNRTIQCDQCGESMVANAYTEHLHTACPERMIKCSISCGLSFKAKDIVKHETEVCVGTCKWGCGRRIGPPEQLALHEACHCSEKPMQCKYRCGVQHMTVKDVRTHEQMICVNRPIMCTLGCGKTFPARLQSQHLEAVRGSCAERPVRCPSNLIGWRIMMLPTNKEGIVLQYRRITKMVDVIVAADSEVGEAPSSSQTLASAIALTADPVLVGSLDPKLPDTTNLVVAPVREQREAEVDQIFVRFEGQQLWIDYWTSHYILLRKVQGDNLSKTQHIDHKFACGWVTFADMNDHLSHECVNREIYLTGDNDKQVSYVGQKTKFKEAVEVAEKRHKFDHFIENIVVKPSTEFCGFCSAEIDILNMEAHLKNTCIENIVKCPYVCGMEMKRKDLDAHLSDECPKRVVLCVDCNSRDLWAEELMSHQQHLCDMRIIPCPLKCDDDKVTACGVDAHCAKECILRPIQCSCGLTMPFKDLDEHQRLHCNDRYYYCPQGCGVQIKQENQEYHTEFQCSNKNFRYQKDVDCPNTCGAIMMIRDVLTHLSYHCPRRMVECTLNCGNTVQLDRLAGHMIFCPMRILPCEPGMNACNRPLHAWFHIEERPPEDDFTNSLFDFDGDDEPSEYGEAVVDTNSVNTSTILSRDGKTVVKFSDLDLARAGLASPEDRRRHKVQLLDTAAIDDKPQSRAQIARRIAKTDQIIRSVLPDETPRADDAPKTLFAAKEINIQFDKKGTLFQSLRVQKADKVSPRAGPDDHNAIYMGARSLASNSSVYHDGFQMKFHHHLRMHVCTLHRASMVFSALRHNDFALMEHVSKQIKDSEDIDFENIYGDTALTLACRMGKLNFIELLVEHAADINMETSNGRTALIEAVKAPVENIPVIEYLISCGCLVNYKTAKHQRTALHWAQRMNRTKTIRILELAILVQVQANKIFFAISTGKFEYVKDMIKEGEFFDANGEARFYAEMKKYADLEDDTHDLLEATKKKLELRGNAADVALQKYKDSLQEQDVAQEQLDQAFAAEDAVNQRISREFAMFEKNSLRLTPVDIQEVVALKKPELLLRLAGFGFAVIFGVLESDDWSPVTPCNVQSCLKWWPILMKEFQRPNEVVRKIQSFTVARLEGGRAVDLITRAKQLFEDMVEALAAEKKKRLTAGSSSLETSLTSPGGSLVRSKTISNMPLQRLGSFVEDTAGSTDLALAGDNAAEKAPIPDADWDSEAEDEGTIAGTGSWVMGEWVPIVTKKDKWWEKHAAEKAPERDPTHFHKAKAKSKFVYLSDEIISKSVKQAPIEAGMQIVRARTPGVAPSSSAGAGGSLNEGSIESLGSADLGGALVDATESDLDSEGGTSRASSRASSAQSPNRPARKQQNRKLSRAGSVGAGIGGASKNAKGRSKGSKGGKERSRGSKRNKVQEWEGPARSLLDIPIEEHLSVLDYETFECLPFIEAMFFMFKAIVRYTEDRQNLVEAKKVTSRSSIHNEDAKVKVLELKEIYDNEFNFRAEMEGQMIELMKKERFYKQRVKSFMEKVRVARLMNEVSMNGHTAVSWAAANGAYELVEEMLTHGATVGFTIPMLNLTATYLQQTYKIYKLNCQANYRHPEDSDEPPPPKVDSIQMVRDITALKEVRDKVLSKLVFMRSRTRFPVPEAVYAGKWEIVKRIYERRLYHAQFSNTWIFPQAPFPYLRKLDKQYEKTKMNIREVLSYGMNDNAAGTYVPSIGWVGPNDHREPFGETQHEIAALLLDLHMKNQLFLAGRKRIRLLAEERINQRTGERAMLKAIKAKDFKKCIELAVKRGITIDLETPEGYTVMLCAAEENVDATNHVFMRNDDGRECLAVEYLLDRMYYRPSVNMEGVVSGHNALIRATILSRAQVVEALLDRGADINYQNRVGRTALHYAAAAGDTVCTRILIERFADKTLKDNNNQTAYEIADSENFSNIMKLLSQFRGGFLGPVQISRGRVNNIVKCPLGCGQNMFPREQEAHCLVCEWRPAPCPLDCGDRTLQWKELPDHVERYCGKRIIMCEDCDIDLEARDLEHHKEDLCTHRLIQCSLGCGYDCKFCDIERHQIHCSWRVIACPLACDENMRAKDSAHHVKELCENRRVPCPYRCRGLVVCKLVPIHMETLCQNRPVLCQFCSTTVTKQEQERHEKECEFRTVPCIDKCGEMVPLAQMSVHLDTTCSHRFVECVQNCGVKIRVKNMDFHTTTQCPERLSFCENGCLVSELVPESERQVQKVLAKVMHLHLKYDCPERQNRCSMCLNYVKAKHCTLHDKEECPKRIVACRVEGCLKQLPMEEREHHERHTCRFRLVVCKQSCGMRIPFIHSGIHMKNACVCRYLDCPLRCATRLRFAELEEHLAYECTRRHMISKKDTEANTLVAAAFKKAASPDLAQGSPSRHGSPNNKQRGGKKPGATTMGDFSFAEEGESGKSKKEVYSKINNMSVEVSDSLKMLALGDKAWTSRLVGSRKQSPPKKNRPRSSEAKQPYSAAPASTPGAKEEDT